MLLGLHPNRESSGTGLLTSDMFIAMHTRSKKQPPKKPTPVIFRQKKYTSWASFCFPHPNPRSSCISSCQPNTFWMFYLCLLKNDMCLYSPPHCPRFTVMQIHQGAIHHTFLMPLPYISVGLNRGSAMMDGVFYFKLYGFKNIEYWTEFVMQSGCLFVFPAW